MIEIFLILFTMTLLYLSIANRLLTYIRILVLQGFLLFAITFFELKQINLANLIFILLETIIFKALAVPIFLNYIIRRNKITRIAEPFVPNFISLLIVTLIIILNFVLAYSAKEFFVSKLFFVTALSTLFVGLYLIITRRKIITHVMGYIVMENGVFVLSIAIGNEMPMLVNLGIMLDIFASVLILGIFFNKIGDVIKDPEVGLLRNLKD